MPKITPFLWFKDKAEEAARYYASIFPNSKIKQVTRYQQNVGTRPKGTVMTVVFELDGQDFIALNGGPQFTFSPATSFVVNCENQEEIDRYWGALSEGGEKQDCGWLKDRYGMSWQVVPKIIEKLLEDADPQRAARVMQALMQMKKLDIAKLKRAYDQPV